MTKRIVTTRDSDGHVVSQWSGGDEQDLAPVAGRTHITIQPDDTRNYIGTKWTGSAFVALPPVPAATVALAESRRKETLSTVAFVVMERDPTAWNAMTIEQRLRAITAVADLWKGLREFVDDKTV